MKLTLSLLLSSYLLIVSMGKENQDKNDKLTAKIKKIEALIAQAEVAPLNAGTRRGELLHKRVMCYKNCTAPEKCNGDEDWLNGKSCAQVCWRICRKLCKGKELKRKRQHLENYCENV